MKLFATDFIFQANCIFLYCKKLARRTSLKPRLFDATSCYHLHSPISAQWTLVNFKNTWYTPSLRRFGVMANITTPQKKLLFSAVDLWPELYPHPFLSPLQNKINKENRSPTDTLYLGSKGFLPARDSLKIQRGKITGTRLATASCGLPKGVMS